MAYFIEMGIANKTAFCEGFRRTCHHGKAANTRKTPGSALCVSGIHLRLPSHVGWAPSPCFGSAPDPHCKPRCTGVFVFGPAILEMFILWVYPVTQDGPFFQWLPVKSLVWSSWRAMNTVGFFYGNKTSVFQSHRGVLTWPHKEERSCVLTSSWTAYWSVAPSWHCPILAHLNVQFASQQG